MALTPDLIADALAALGGKAPLNKIYEKVVSLASERGISIPTSYKHVIRGRIEERSSDSDVWKAARNKKQDLFYSVHGIGDGVWGLRSMQGVGAPMDFIDPAEGLITADEGALLLKWHLKRERSLSLVAKFKSRLRTYECTVCGFDFENMYGEIGRGFIEAHHVIPLSETMGARKTAITDLIAVCSNCHRMLHGAVDIDRDGLKTLIERKRAAAS